MTRILLLADESHVSAADKHILTRAGLEIIEPDDNEDALGRLPEADVVVLDFVDQADAAELCQYVRASANAPILALAKMTDGGELSPGLEEADDYAVEPVSANELLARVRLLLRRSGRRTLTNRMLHVRDLTIDQERLQVLRDDKQINLTPTQFRLLACLARNAGRVMTGQELLKEAQGYECDEQEAQEIVKVHINHLRQKIETGQGSPTYIVNVRGFGYMLERRGSRA